MTDNTKTRKTPERSAETLLYRDIIEAVRLVRNRGVSQISGEGWSVHKQKGVTYAEIQDSTLARDPAAPEVGAPPVVSSQPQEPAKAK